MKTKDRLISKGNTFEFLPKPKLKKVRNVSPNISDNEKTLVDLVNGVKPETPDQEALLADIQDIKKRGRIVEIPDETY